MMDWKGYKEKRELKKNGIEIVDEPEKVDLSKENSKEVNEKKGFMKRVDAFLSTQGEKYKKYKEEAPQRRQAELQKMKDQQEILQAKSELMGEKAKFAEQKQKLSEIRNKGMKDISEMNKKISGGGMGGMGMGNMNMGGFGGSPQQGKRKNNNQHNEPVMKMPTFGDMPEPFSGMKNGKNKKGMGW
jgi:ElaB/YqjD/DUF883 family membrane-anchored ribosome-binding protein